MAKPCFERAWLGVILGGYLVIGTLYAAYTPAWQAPDEPAHYNYVRHLAERGELPILQAGDYPQAYLEQLKAARFPPQLSIAPLRYEAWQPPLYYVLAAPLYQLTGGGLLPLRLFSVALGAGTILLSYAIGARLVPGDRQLALAAAAFVAYLPMHLAMSAAVNNDGLAELLIAAVVWRLLAWDGVSQLPWRSVALTGLLLGLALITKATSYYTLLPLAVLAVLWSCRRPAQLLARAAALLGPAVAVALPWWLRNVSIYGWPDLLGKLHHDQVVVGQLRTGEYLGQVGWPAYLADLLSTSFHSFWGQFGWMAVPMDSRVYLLLGLLSALAVAGWLAVAWQARPARPAGEATSAHLTRYRLVLLGLWLALTVGGYLYYNVQFVQFQGRYLFPALTPIALLMVWGWRKALTRRGAWLGAGLAAGVTAVSGLAGGAGGRPDKWSLALGGGLTLALWARRWLPAGWDSWLVALPLIGLAMLAVYSLFAYVVPNL